MFKTIKQHVDILDVVKKDLDQDLRSAGESTYEPEDKVCPFCQHRECFKIKATDEDTFFNCFSCGEKGDVVSYVSKRRGISLRDAALLLAKEYNVTLPSAYSPVQDIFNLAAFYYRKCLSEDTNSYPELNKLTPEEYQLRVRRHTKESLAKFNVGWSDGGLVAYLLGVGFEKELIESSGLMGKKGGDFLPAKCFIYPHYIDGKVSHFTFKDPLKQKAYQLRNSHKLNDHSFYNSDSLKNTASVIIVEGENDVISLDECGWNGGVIGAIGQISASQLDWIDANLKDKSVVSIFDNDPAGDKYRDKLEKFRHKFKSLIQVKVGNGLKDIDEYLKSGGDLPGLIESGVVVSPKPFFEEGDSPPFVSETGVTVFEKNGNYFKMVRKKGDEGWVPYRLSNFVIELQFIYHRDGEMQRICVLTREDGKKSNPRTVTSDMKVSLRSFKNMVADAVDGVFYGMEGDLTSMWEMVYKTQTPREIIVPDKVGRVDECKGWLFKNIFISDTQDVYTADEDGVVWFRGTSKGIKAVSQDSDINVDKAFNVGVPDLPHTIPAEERASLEENFIKMLAENLGDTGTALTIAGWAKANAYSNIFFEWTHGFPYLFIWGERGAGKTVIAKWVLSLFDMDGHGHASIPQLNSGVGFNRKLGYYSSLPVIVDEVRQDKTTTELLGPIRTWYNRIGRVLASKDNPRLIRSEKVLSNIIFVGEDVFSDSACRQRTVTIRVARNNREKRRTYSWIEGNRTKLRSVGFHWILESQKADLNKLKERFEAISLRLCNYGAESRTAMNWTCAAVFAEDFAEKYFPNYDYQSYVKEAITSKEDIDNKDEMVERFFEQLEGLQVAERSEITSEHIKVEDGYIYLWLDELYRLTRRSGQRAAEDGFSQKAIRKSLKDEDYFVSHGVKHPMGMREILRRTTKLRLENAPDSIKNIAQVAASF